MNTMIETTKFLTLTQHKGRDYREVDVPNSQLEKCTTIEQKLSLIFDYGQNMFQSRRGFCSLSANDIIRFEDKLFLICGVGFKEIDIDTYTKIRSFYILIEDTYDLPHREQQKEYFRLREKVSIFFKENDLGYF